MGAGGVLYLSPLFFNSLGFTAGQIGSGITVAAFAGIVTRLVTGFFLDKKYSYVSTIKIASLIAIISDLILFNSQNYLIYIAGQFFLGAAAGIYWPSVELAIPLNCIKKINTSEGFALARTADAIGITLGSSIGTIGTYLSFIRIIYLIDTFCMIYIIYILSKQIYNLKYNNPYIAKSLNSKDSNNKLTKTNKENWLISIIPILSTTLFITGVMSLLQGLLPIDLAIGGIRREPLIESSIAEIISFKLILIAIFQWPIGYLIKDKKTGFKFSLCLINLLIGLTILTLSNILINGYLLVLLALVPITISLCIFLPSASDAIIKTSPIQRQGSAIALYSQCFGISAFTFPWLAGKIIDHYQSGIQLWLVVCLICILFLPITRKIK